MKFNTSPCRYLSSFIFLLEGLIINQITIVAASFHIYWKKYLVAYMVRKHRKVCQNDTLENSTQLSLGSTLTGRSKGDTRSENTNFKDMSPDSMRGMMDALKEKIMVQGVEMNKQHEIFKRQLEAMRKNIDSIKYPKYDE